MFVETMREIMLINNIKLVRFIKWRLYYIFDYFFKQEAYFYRKYNKSTKIKRLFITTGNISLVNILAIINEIGNFDKYEDTLVIDTGKGQKEFVDKQLQIASLHKFKKIIADPRINPGVQLVLYNHYKVDEIYLLNHPMHFKTVLPLFKNIPITLIDEGAGSLINYNSDKIESLKCYKTHKYFGKIDFIGLEDADEIKFETVDINEFRKIASVLSIKYPIETKNSKTDKIILYCGVYWEVSGLDKETFTRIQNKLLNDLLDAGYKIMYKPHPRDTEFYGLENNPNVEFITSKFPIELYNLDVLAVVSMSSTCLLSIPHYWEIPCFSNVVEKAVEYNPYDIVKINLIRFIVGQYSPTYKMLLDLDVNNTSREELKIQIKNMYDNFMKDKPLLSQNQKIKDYMRGMNETKK